MVRRLDETSSLELAAAIYDSTAEASFENGSIKGREFVENMRAQVDSIQNKQVRNDLDKIVKGVSGSVGSVFNDIIISDLPDGVGGEFRQNREIYINKKITKLSSRRPGQTIQSAIQENKERLMEAVHHEETHKNHNDNKGLLLPKDGLLLGGITLNPREIMEGANMSVTGKEYVSLEYKRIHKKFQTALSKSGVPLSKFIEALKERNVAKLDDRFRSTNRAAA